MWPFKRMSPEERLADKQERERIRQERVAAQGAFEQLLDKAAAISSAKIVCHHDTWSFADAWARDRSSYTRPTSGDIVDLPNRMCEIRLSGPNLVTLLIVTREQANAPYAGTRAIASRIYRAIEEVVNLVDVTVKGGATVPIIIIDAAPKDDEIN